MSIPDTVTFRQFTLTLNREKLDNQREYAPDAPPSYEYNCPLFMAVHMPTQVEYKWMAAVIGDVDMAVGWADTLDKAGTLMIENLRLEVEDLQELLKGLEA